VASTMDSPLHQKAQEDVTSYRVRKSWVLRSACSPKSSSYDVHHSGSSCMTTAQYTLLIWSITHTGSVSIAIACSNSTVSDERYR